MRLARAAANYAALGISIRWISKMRLMPVRQLWRLSFAFLLLVALAPSPRAQAANSEPNVPGDKPGATVTFDIVFPPYSPAHSTVTVDSSGRASYHSDDLRSSNADKNALLDPYSLEFTLSVATTAKIFKLTQEADYFRGDFAYTKGNIANTGDKTLTYREGPADPAGKPAEGKRYQTAYNYSENPAIKELTSIFQGIGQTVEIGRRLAFLRRFDKLGLDATLKQAVEMANSGYMQEIPIIAPTLRAIMDDFAVMRIARQRAEHLLKMNEAAQ